MAMVARPYEGLNSVSRLFSAEIDFLMLQKWRSTGVHIGA